MTSVLAPVSFPDPNADMMQIVPLTTSLVTTIPTFVLVLLARGLKTKNLFKTVDSSGEDGVPMCSTAEEPLCKNSIED